MRRLPGFIISSVRRCLPVLLAGVVIIFVSAGSLRADSLHADSADSGALPAATAQIQALFNQLEIAGNAYNGGGGDAAGRAVLSSGCAGLSGSGVVRDFMAEYLLPFGPGAGASSSLSTTTSTSALLRNSAQGILRNSAQSLLGAGISAGCAALSGGAVDVGDGAGIGGGLQDQLMLGLIGAGRQMANESGLPFLERLELETGTERGEWVSSVTTIQPLWKDEAGGDHVFTQLAWRQVDGEDTVNAGLAWRRINAEKTILYGVNAFFDHAFTMNHNRMSIGADVQTSLLGGSVNKYIPLSGWKSRDVLWEEKAAGGFDAELHGQVPQLPSWTAYIKGYRWDGSDDQYAEPSREIEDTFGFLSQLEYAPVPALAVRGGLRRENHDGISGEFALRLNLRFNEPLELQFKPRLHLASVEDRIYNKVSRENTIRVQERRKASGLLTVTETVGANTVSGQPGLLGLSVGQTVLMPATVTVANTVGAIARLRFADGAILTIGQNSVVTIDTTLITLVSGTMQYISGATNVVINVPGGTITLLGTDIDLRSDGTLSTVRVREGSIRLDGTTAGSATIGVGQMAQSNSGTVTTVAAGTAPYIAHTDDVSAKIDRVATPVTGIKVAPYPVEAPRLVTTATTPGQVITLGLRFNTVVTAAGGPPRLGFTINGNARTADLSAGSGTNDLRFDYTLQGGDAGASTALIVTGFDNNGATITGDGKAAVTTIADTTLDLGAAVGSTATLTMNFLTNVYTLLGTTYNSLTAFLTATGGTFARTSTATYFDAAGTLQTAAAGTPRFDHDPVTLTAKGLLMEEGRTNSYQRSMEFNNAYWTKAAMTITADAALAPDGTTTADLAVPTAVNAFHYVGRAQAFSAVPYTLSVFMKTAGYRYGQIQFGNHSVATFDLQNGVIAGGAANATMTSIGNGWYRCTLTSANPSASTGAEFTFRPDTSQFGFTGNGTSGGYIWGTQLEQAPFATSYIPTTTVAVARQADTLTFPASLSWYNSSAGSMVVQARPAGVSSNFPQLAMLGDSTVNNWLAMTVFPANGYRAELKKSAVTDFLIGAGTMAAGSLSKASVAYQSGSSSAVLNAGAASTSAVAFTPLNANLLSIGSNLARGATDGRYSGHYTGFEYYPTRLPDATLQTLTTP